MMHGTFGKVFIRVMAVVGIVVFTVVLVRVILAILQPLVPGAVTVYLAQGAQMLLGYIAPALPAVAALGLLYGLWWVITGRK